MRISKSSHRVGLETFEGKTFFQGEAIEAAIRELIAYPGLNRPDAALGLLEPVFVKAALGAGGLASLPRQAAEGALLDPPAATAAQQVLARIPD